MHECSFIPKYASAFLHISLTFQHNTLRNWRRRNIEIKMFSLRIIYYLLVFTIGNITTLSNAASDDRTHGKLPQGFGETVVNLDESTNTQMAQEIKTLMENFTQWFENTKFTRTNNIDGVITELENVVELFERLDTIDKNNISLFSKTLCNVFQSMRFPGTCLADFGAIMSSKNDYVINLDQEKGNTSELWTPMLKFIDKLKMYRKWYKFCQDVKHEMRQYAFQVHVLPSLARKNHSNVLEFLEQNDIVAVASRIKTIYQNFTTCGKSCLKHLAVLKNIVSRYTTPANWNCTGDTFKVEGTIVYFSDFLNNDGELLDNTCKNATTITVWAWDIVYIDQSFNGVDREILLSIWAPNCSIIRNPEIRLQGKNANSVGGQVCMNGLPGYPGGPGGSLYLATNNVTKPENLAVFVTGGRGSNGQNGCDGAAGETAPVNESQESFVTFLVYSYRQKCFDGDKGGPGQFGGHGGKGGYGGESGYILASPEIKARMKISIGSGAAGQDGRGGKGGSGGKGTATKCCIRHYAFWHHYRYNCKETYEHPMGVAGGDGIDGLNTNGMLKPKPARKINLEKTKYEYDEWVKSMGDLE